ncbi:UNVERIFIED_CONTAM: Kelch repeat-containing protein [Sesamum calycinum]|uniref:Kelch repeat-containing protein n=1 Tax=Sesamum calycinum TaxID=2727403 RepID=A0AAW2MMZ7_9LAMI
MKQRSRSHREKTKNQKPKKSPGNKEKLIGGRALGRSDKGRRRPVFEICRCFGMENTVLQNPPPFFHLFCLLGIALTVDVFWASRSSSSSSVYSSIASNWPREKSHVVVVPKAANDTDSEETVDDKPQTNHVSERLLSATFADIPAPELEWEQMPSAPVPRLDGSAVQIKDLLYVFSGYGTLDYVHSHVDIYNFTDNTWSGRLEAPKDMANSHLGVATDGRYVYVVAGQSGPQCRTPPTSNTFVLDTETEKWERFAPLPAPRYAPATQIWKGRLHVMGGSKENRHTPGTDHWSIAVKDGKAIEKEWRNETPIPRGDRTELESTSYHFHSSHHKEGSKQHGLCLLVSQAASESMKSHFFCIIISSVRKLKALILVWKLLIVKYLNHQSNLNCYYSNRACVAVGDELYVIGGQEGDFMPKPGSPNYKCSRRNEVVYGDVYMLDSEMKWTVLAPMPKPNSHIECSWFLWNNSIIIMGGTTEKHPVNKRMILVGEVFRFHLDTKQWSVIGRLPYRVKTTLAAFWDGWMYFTSGQRDRGPDNPQPKKVVGEMWRTKLKL